MKYKIIDKTPEHELWKRVLEKDKTDIIMAHILDKEKEIEVGDMFWVRDTLIEMGYKLWKDFSIKKMED